MNHPLPIRKLLHTFSLGILVSLTPACGEDPKTAKNDADLNRLADEKSPYLQQHASNPVDWYPWGEEAFAKARKENKPIFLSIGYSTCHWCHVMAHESFSNEEIAAVMNEHFVNIKVDREERPDIDNTYMTFVQATTGRGGWPMSVWLTPDLKPFVGGTYFPPKDAQGRPGFKSVLEQLATAWENQEKEIREQAGNITNQLKDITSGARSADNKLPLPEASKKAFEQLSQSFDAEYGGFGPAPKFPQPSNFHFLHHLVRIHGKGSETGQKALEMSTFTLKKMARGGMYDHLGGGFHRYSVDRYWHIPHYEKMLYDQAQLVVAYLDAAQLAGREDFRKTARDILAYVDRRMTHPDGGFYSAEDADSLRSPDAEHKSEGAFYIWEKQEIDKLLGDKAPLFNRVYGVKADGNAPEGSDPHKKLVGTNTLIRRHNPADVAADFDLEPEKAASMLAEAERILFEAREKRAHPHRDEKILTAWNGLMISAYAQAYQQLGDPKYLRAATRAAEFIRDHLYNEKTGILGRSYLDGASDIDGFASDYAYLIAGLLDLYEAGFDHQWLAWAKKLQTKQDELFLDQKVGGYYKSSGRDPSVLLRAKDLQDGAQPSENSVSALNLHRLSAMLGQPKRHQQARETLHAFAKQIESSPRAAPLALVALHAVRSKPTQIMIAGTAKADDTQTLLRIVRQHARPNQVVLLADGGKGQKFLAEHADFYSAVKPIKKRATAYICEDFVCQLPTPDPEKVQELLTREQGE